jgi:predicted nucleic acid-binding protein
MEAALILETTFLIDLERSRLRGKGPALDLLRRHPDHRLFITPTIAGELACGRSLSARSAWESFVAPFRVLQVTPDVQWEYGRLFRFLQDNGLLIGSNDLWVAATGLAYQVPVVTRNESHFRRIPDLTVVGYGKG